MTRVNIVMMNDDDHSAKYFNALLMRIFRRTKSDAFSLVQEINSSGHAVVWSGPKEVAELKLEQVQAAPPEISRNGTITTALECYMEERDD